MAISAGAGNAWFKHVQSAIEHRGARIKFGFKDHSGFGEMMASRLDFTFGGEGSAS